LILSVTGKDFWYHLDPAGLRYVKQILLVYVYR